MSTEEQAYDPFNLPEPSIEQTRAKHFLDSNGLWLFIDYKDSFLDEKCLCDCAKKCHLACVSGTIDADSICLNPQCICIGYVQKDTKVIIPKSNGKPPRKVLIPEIQEDPRLNSYVQMLSKV